MRSGNDQVAFATAVEKAKHADTILRWAAMALPLLGPQRGIKAGKWRIPRSVIICIYDCLWNEQEKVQKISVGFASDYNNGKAYFSGDDNAIWMCLTTDVIESRPEQGQCFILFEATFTWNGPSGRAAQPARGSSGRAAQPARGWIIQIAERGAAFDVSRKRSSLKQRLQRDGQVRVLEVHAGLGGWSRAFRMAGNAVTVGAVDLDPARGEIWRQEGIEFYNIDVTNVSRWMPLKKLEPHVVAGAPPCTPFAKGGLQRRWEDQHAYQTAFPFFLGWILGAGAILSETVKHALEAMWHEMVKDLCRLMRMRFDYKVVGLQEQLPMTRNRLLGMALTADTIEAFNDEEAMQLFQMPAMKGCEKCPWKRGIFTEGTGDETQVPFGSAAYRALTNPDWLPRGGAGRVIAKGQPVGAITHAYPTGLWRADQYAMRSRSYTLWCPVLRLRNGGLALIPSDRGAVLFGMKVADDLGSNEIEKWQAMGNCLSPMSALELVAPLQMAMSKVMKKQVAPSLTTQQLQRLLMNEIGAPCIESLPQQLPLRVRTTVIENALDDLLQQGFADLDEWSQAQRQKRQRVEIQPTMRQLCAALASDGSTAMLAAQHAQPFMFGGQFPPLQTQPLQMRQQHLEWPHDAVWPPAQIVRDAARWSPSPKRGETAVVRSTASSWADGQSVVAPAIDQPVWCLDCHQLLRDWTQWLHHQIGKKHRRALQRAAWSNDDPDDAVHVRHCECSDQMGRV